MGKFVQTFLISLITFVLFYFNTPYWTGSEMRDVCHNGVYRAFYVLLSTIGYFCYKLVEIVCNSVSNALHFGKNSIAHVTLNLLIYVLVVYAATYYYDFSMNYLTGGAAPDLNLMPESSYAKLSDVVAFWGVFSNFKQLHASVGLFAAIWKTFCIMGSVVVETVIFFSVMYRMLSQKCVELHIVDRFFGESEEQDAEPETIFAAVWQAIREGINKLVFFRNFEFISVVLTAVIFIALRSVILLILGRQPDMQGLLLRILDEFGVIDILASFVLSFLYAKVVVVISRGVYRVLPEVVRNVIDTVSDAGNALVETITERRNRWSAQHDWIYQETESTLHEMSF